MDITVPVPMVYSYKKPLLSLTINSESLDKKPDAEPIPMR
jgi:hypothetical protein